MSSRAELKRRAKTLLKGKSGMLALNYILWMVIAIALGFLDWYGKIATLIISPVVAYGLIKACADVRNTEEHVGVFDFLTKGFAHFLKAWLVPFFTGIRMWGPILVDVVAIVLMFSGLKLYIDPEFSLTVNTLFWVGLAILVVGSIWSILLSYKYMCVYYEFAMEPSKSSWDIVKDSGKKMVGHRWQAFVLSLSFIGWFLLSIIGLGIPLLWVIPYMNVTFTLFYEEVSGRKSENTTEQVAAIQQ